MPNIKWLVTLGVAINRDLDSDENPWYKETVEIDAPENAKEKKLKVLAWEKIIAEEIDNIEQENISCVWVEECEPKEDDEWDEESLDVGIQ
jgi:hypothetical protein